MHVMLFALLALSVICLNSSTRENLALKRPAFQTSVLRNYGAALAVDGNRNVIFGGYSCTHTPELVQPWWAVDLGKTTCITDVTLTNRARAYQRLADFQIGATNTNPNENEPLVGDYFVCASQVPAMRSGETKNFVCKAVGQYLIVQLKGEDYMTLCEVEVYGINDTCNDRCENGGACCFLDFDCTCKDDFFGDRCQFNEGEMYSFHTDKTTTYETVHLATLFNYALFSVRVCKDAYLALSANPGDTTADTTEVILGVGTNSNSEIRNGVNGDVAVTASTPDILSCENQTSFWISWKGGEIRIGGGDVVGTDQILQSTISHTVSWIHIRTGQDVGVWRVPRINVKFVEQETKSEHSFEQMSLDQRDLPYQSFRVQACSDVHVVLSSVVHHNETFVTGTTYEVVIGGWSNTKSAIRVGLLSGNEWNVTVDTSNFLTCDQYSPFWIKWEENAIKVGQGEDPEQNQFMNLTDENWMFAPTSMGISTGNGTGGKWQLKNLDCSKCLNDATNCVAQSAPEDFEVNCTCAPGYHGDQCGYTYVADNVTLIAEPKPFMEAYQRCQELEYTMLAFTEGDLQHETLRNLTNCGYNGNVWIALHKTEYAELLMIPWGIPPPYTNFPSGVEATLGLSPDWAVSVNLATLEWGVTNASLELPYVCEGGNDPCSDTCKNGGSCCNIDLSFKCTCVDGFTGDRCELIDHCFNVTCANNFTCKLNSGNTDFYCNCNDNFDFFGGKLCELVNLALGKPALQSSTAYVNKTDASNGVDGDHINFPGPYVEHSLGQCIFTTAIELNPWWSVDLGTSYRIDYIVVMNWIYHTDDYVFRLSQFKIGTNAVNPSISAPTPDNINVCAQREEPVPNNGSIKLNCHTYGKYIVLIRSGSVLGFCELQVFGFPSDIIYCDGNPCQHDGTCIAGNNGTYACECVAGYEGTTCEIDINECSSDPCLNGGECTDGINKYVCTCIDGYAGIFCQIDPGYIGCFADTEGVRDLGTTEEKIESNTSMVVPDCIQACRDMGRDYAGLQNGQVCFCGNSYGSYGIATNCDMPCTGNSLQICGGLLSNSVFRTKCNKITQHWDTDRGICYTLHAASKTYDEAVAQCSHSNSYLASVLSLETNQRLQSLMTNHSVDEIWLGLKLVKAVPGLWRWSDGFPAMEQGCYVDNSDDRDLPNPVLKLWSFAYASPTVCISECKRLGYEYTGMQGPRSLSAYTYNHRHHSVPLLMDYQCFCGNSFGKHGESVYPDSKRCTWRCVDPDQSTCGNFDRNSILAVRGKYSKWKPTQPDNKAGNEYCAIMMNRYNAYDFADESCSSKHRYICDVPLSQCLSPSRNDVNYELWNKQCFVFSGSDRQTWFQARVLCMDLRGSLVQVKSKEMHKFLSSKLNRVDESHWIGLAKHKYKWQYFPRVYPPVWSQVYDHAADSELYGNWADSEPSMMKECGTLEKATTPEEYMWRGRDCTEPAAAFICAQRQPSGWICRTTGCYYVPTLLYPKTKAEADIICASMGAHVAAPDTEEENVNIMVLALFSGFRPEYGLFKLVYSGIWINLIDDTTWAHSGKEANYTNWRHEEPDNALHTCTAAVEEGLWRDVPCDWINPYLCEKD